VPLELTTTYQEVNGVLVARPKGSISGLVDDWSREVEDRLRPDARGMVLSMSGVEFISSRGLGVLLYLHKLMTGRGTRLHLAEPSESVLDSLDVAGLDSLLTIYQTEAEALAAF